MRVYSLPTRCSLQSECEDAYKPLHWLPYKGAQCTRILHVYPSQVQIPASTSEESRQVCVCGCVWHQCLSVCEWERGGGGSSMWQAGKKVKWNFN